MSWQVQLGDAQAPSHVALCEGDLALVFEAHGALEVGAKLVAELADTLIADFREACEGALDLEEALWVAACAWNSRVYHWRHKRRHQAEGATSVNAMRAGAQVCALAMRGDQIALCHIGNPRALLLRQGATRALTRDHSLFNKHVELGLVEAQDERTFKWRHVATRWMGMSAWLRPEVALWRVVPGDVILLCSEQARAQHGLDALWRGDAPAPGVVWAHYKP